METTPAQFEALVEDWEAERKETSANFASIMAIIAEVNRNPKKRGRPYSPSDFLPREEKDEPVDAETVFKQLKAVFGDSVKRKKD